MQKIIVDKLVNYIITKRELTIDEIRTIKYGISNLYLLISKTIVITSIAIILDIFIPYLVFTIFYNIIRMPSFGLHAKKSYQCWIYSTIIFIGIPHLITIIDINTLTKYILLIFTTIYIAIYSPADTIKRPIISKKRRMIYKLISTLLCLLYSLICIYTENKIMENALLFSLILQCIIISPITYKIFRLPYNNYKNYIRKEAENVS